MSDLSARLALPYLLPAQAQKHVTHNEALARLDMLVQLAVEEIGANTPPGLPIEGQVWALGAAPTGDWAGQGAGTLAAWNGTAWVFVMPEDGWSALSKPDGSLNRWDGSDWVAIGGSGDLDNLDGLGVNTTHDATNRLAVAAPATLLSHEGAGHQLKINKAAMGDTASLLFQTGWSGRAEMGTTGNDDFAIKTSADGAAWTTAIAFDAASGIASGAAVQNSATDIGTGKLARADYAYGPGNLLGTVTQSGGTPTGAVIERGSNANGSYTRFADGTQICWEASVPTVSNGPAFWTFPALFVDSDASVLAMSNFASQARIIATASITAADVELHSWHSNGSANVSPVVRVMAIGRWY